MIVSLKSYPEMKDSGLPWLGEVPEHWKMERAKWLFRKMDRPVEEQNEVVTCFRDGVVTLRKNRRIRGFTEALKEIGYQGVRCGDLVIHAMDAFAGAVGVSDSDGKGTPVYSVCEPALRANAYYYAYTVREMARGQWIQALAKGIRERSTDFRFDGFGSQTVPVPPLREQAAIVRFLDHVDRRIRRFIRAKQKLIKVLEEQKQAIIHRAVTRGLDPNVRLKPSGVEWLGDLPVGWEVRKIGSLGIFYKGRGIARADITDTGVPAITYGDIYTKYGIEINSLGKYTSDAVAANAQKIVKGDLLFTASGETIEEIGKTTLYSGEVTGYAGGDIIILQLHNGDGLYLSYALNCGLGIRQKSAFGRGDIIVHISASKLKQVVVPFPPLEEQTAIAKHLDQAVAHVATAISHSHREIDLLREYRTRLIADVVTGKLDVREAAARLPDETEDPKVPDEIDAIDLDEDMIGEGDGTDNIQEAEV
jgi:type I restriction enzyme S subunit